MKKILLAVIILLFAMPAYGQVELARLSPAMVGGSGTSAPAGDSCTSGLLLSWHAENVDVTLGTPAGCSAADSVAALNSGAVISSAQYTDGANSLSIPSIDDYATFTPSGGDIFNRATGTLIFSIRFVAVTNNSSYVVVRDSVGGHAIKVVVVDTDELRFRYDVGGTENVATTDGANVTTGTWYTVTVKWRETGNPNLYIDVDGLNSGTNNTDLTLLTNQPDFLYFGDYDGGGVQCFFDAIKIYDSYL